MLSKRVTGTGHPFDQECAITENATVLCSKHEYKDVINEQLLSTLPSEVTECHASDSDYSGAPLNKFQITKLNQSKSAPPQVLKLKCGARVVITRNIDVAGGVVNGTIGTVENIQPNLITVRRLKDNELMCITRIKHYVSLRHSTDIAIREQFLLILGWAITVHRVQGMTISSNVFVVLDSTFFALGQAYVALSRVKKICPNTSASF